MKNNSHDLYCIECDDFIEKLDKHWEETHHTNYEISGASMTIIPKSEKV